MGKFNAKCEKSHFKESNQCKRKLKRSAKKNDLKNEKIKTANLKTHEIIATFC